MQAKLPYYPVAKEEFCVENAYNRKTHPRA